jgi:hypothetical protein
VHHILHGWDLSDPVMLITAENAGNTTKGTYHTHHTCLKGPDKEKWMDAEFGMLDKNNSYGMYGTPTKRGDVPFDAKLIRPIWHYTQKGDGVHKARKCMDGNTLVRMGVKFSNT